MLRQTLTTSVVSSVVRYNSLLITGWLSAFVIFFNQIIINMNKNSYKQFTSRTRLWKGVLGSLLMTLLCVSHVNAQYFSEDFEAAFTGSPAVPSGWSITNFDVHGNSATLAADGVDGWHNWTQATRTGAATWTTLSGTPYASGTRPNGTAVSGTKALFMNEGNFGGTGTILGSRRISTPTVDLSSSTSPYVTFQFWHGNATDRLYVRLLASNDNGATWSIISHISNNTNQTTANAFASSSPWQLTRVKVPAAFQTATTKFAFEFSNSWSSQDVWIDDLVIAEFTPGTITSAGTGNWSSTATWVGGVVPSASDNVVIASGHTVSMDYRATRCQNLTVNGTLQYLNTAATEVLHVMGDMSVGVGGTYRSGTSGSNGKRTLVTGNFSNAGTSNFTVSTASALVMVGYNQSISNTGTIAGTPAHFRAIHMLGGGTLTVNNPITISNTVSAISGTFNFTNVTLGASAVSTTLTINRNAGSFINDYTAGAGVTRSITFTAAVTGPANECYFAQSQALSNGTEFELSGGVRKCLGTLTMNTNHRLDLASSVTVGSGTAGGLTLTKGIIVSTSSNLFSLDIGTGTNPTGTAPTTSAPVTNQGSYIVGPYRIVLPTTGTSTRTYALGLGTAFANAGATAVLANRYIPFALGGGTWAANMDFTASIEGSSPSGTVNTPLYFLNSSLGYRLQKNGSADLPITATIALTGNNFTAGNSDNMTYGAVEQLAVAQATSLSGPWAGRNATAAGGTAFGTNTNRTVTSATAAPGPIGPLATNGEYFTIGSTVNPNWTVGTIAATQQTGAILKGTNNNPVMSINIPVSGVAGFGGQTLTAITLTDLLSGGNGGNTNVATDVTNVRLWSTGATATYTSPVLLATGTFSAGSLTFSGLTQALALGNNYIWVTYDVPTGATTANLLDFQVLASGITITETAPGVAYGASSPALNPTGTRTVSAISSFDFNITRTTGNTYTTILGAGGGTDWLPVATSSNDDVQTPNLVFATDPAFGGVPFVFSYQGSAVTSVSANSNGWLGVNNGINTYVAPGFVWVNNLGSASGRNIIAGFWDDLRLFPVGDNSCASCEANLRYKVDGTSPNRVLTVEWKAYSFGNTGTDVSINFQVKLYETSNNIEIVNGNMSIFDGNNNFGYDYSTGIDGGAAVASLAGNTLANQQENTNIYGNANTGTSNSGANAQTGAPECYSTILFTNGAGGSYSGGSALPAITNDECASAISLTLGSSAPTSYCSRYRSTGATNSGVALPVALTGTNPDDDVWFSWTMGTPNDVSIFCPGEGGYNTAVEVFSGTCGSLTSVSSINAVGAGARELLNMASLAAGTYYIRVFHTGTGFGQTPASGSTSISADGYFALEAYKTPPVPANNNLAGALALTLGATCVNSYTDQYTLGATASPEAVCGGTPDDDVWYSFTAVDALTTITVACFDGYNAHVEIMNAAGTTSILCQNNAGVDASEVVNVNTVCGTSYLVRVYHTQSGASTAGYFNICAVTTPTPPACATLSAPANASNLYGPDGATLTWAAVTGATSYDVYMDGSNPPTTLVTNVVAPTVTYATGALTNGLYYWQIVPKNCDGDATGCTIRSFTATNCPDVSALTASGMTATTADLAWTAHISQTSWDIEIGLFGFTPTGTPTNPAVGNPYTVTGLSLGEQYSYYVRPTCGGAWVGPYSFYTLPCEPTYTFGKTDGDLIALVQIPTTTLNNPSGAAEINPAYTYFTGQANYTASLQAGTVYTVNVTVGSFGSQNMACWIDFDDDGLYESSERVGYTTSSIAADGSASFPISLPCNPSVGPHRMRVRDVFATSGVNIDPCANYGFGETEDYLITVIAPPPCPVPSALTLVSSTSTSATIGWTIGCTETEWDLHLTSVGGGLGGAPNYPNITSNPRTFNSLTPSTGYDVYVRANCGGGNGESTWVGPLTFYTAPANDELCNATTLVVNNGCASIAGTINRATDSGEPDGSCYFGSGINDVWYKFVAPYAVPANTASVILNTQLAAGGLNDGVFTLYSATGTCPTLTLTEIACDDDSGPSLLPSITATGLTTGQTYYLRMQPFGTSNGNGNFSLCAVNGGAPVPANDNIAGAINIPGNNSWYPQCSTYSGDCSLSSNSAESTTYTGLDNWYKFTAVSTAVSIEMNSTGLNNAIQMVYESSPGVYTSVDSENTNGATGGVERMNTSGLTVGTVYYISFGDAFNTTGGAFTFCVKQLLLPTCNTPTALPMSNCATFKSSWTGANSYTYTLAPLPTFVGGGSVTAPGSISLSNPLLNVVPGNSYSVTIAATYSSLLNSNGGTDAAIVVTNTNACSLTAVAHASIEVRASQRCAAPATLLKTSYMRTDPFVCGATNYTYEFQPVTDCAATNTAGLSFEYTNTSRIIALNFPGTATTPSGQTIQAQTYYQVRVRPNFGTGGVNQGQWGNPQVIFVGGTVLETEQALSEMAAEADRMNEESMFEALVYPNPSNGEVVNLNLENVTSDNVFVRITDATGRVVYNNRYVVEGALNTVVTFAQPLANGLYTVEFIVDDQRITERMMIQK
jgi:hypothetical protein